MKHGGRGFSFIELAVVLSILGVLALLIYPMVEIANTRQKEAALKQALLDIRQALDAYKDASLSGFIQAGTESGYPADLEDLLRHRDHLGRPFLRAVPVDPFHDGDTDSAAASWNTRAYQSVGVPRQAGRDIYDVNSKSGRVGSNGLPYSEW
jgi:general secretion pathway protein G